MSRQLVILRTGFKYFDKNKSWILGGLFIFSIIKDCVWYACFGVNILAYSNIQDTFISLFNYLIIFVVIPLIYFSLSVLFEKAKFESFMCNVFQQVIKYSIFLVLSFVYFFMFKKIVSFIYVIIFIGVFSYYIYKRRYLKLFRLLFVYFTFISLFSPLFNYMEILNKIEKGRNLQFMVKEDNMDYFSFVYEEGRYDTLSKRFYMVGNTTDYIFLFDAKINKTLIFPKIECKHIQAEVFILANYINR
ncbi:hypothetical protein ACHRVW_03255 [Flavobacterium collinsii]|uniref:hypothetical protein n=1 Tax=Flavobacterium collinsii TaxID=1114861 RepID=UPI003756F9ED